MMLESGTCFFTHVGVLFSARTVFACSASRGETIREREFIRETDRGWVGGREGGRDRDSWIETARETEPADGYFAHETFIITFLPFVPPCPFLSVPLFLGL